MPCYCKGDNCKGKNKRSYYNFAGLQPKFCSNCKKPDMINVVDRKCIKCKLKRPSFNLPTEKKGSGR